MCVSVCMYVCLCRCAHARLHVCCHQEQFNDEAYNEKSDLWSLGCLAYELCALVPPFTAPNQKVLSVKVREGKFRRIPTTYSSNLQAVIASLLTTDVRLLSSIILGMF